ncbi:DNA polymerase III, delta subunit [Desulfatibacillum aliphaticivorans]|uniref:DNA-directed DNA polymerase n=1 Tax=Desulfatibacillum aliphaticivorans TaxID=218208 RepID=B8FFQ9_DESAL|nr:DNA polymerase III subunit delta [Desulfatibacillum aliphaticivorans]ACL03464.1 DNA polymerase III, delta subunit [Desulfatibacillum aliphaticivorans]
MEINHANLDSILQPKDGFVPVYLIYGDEMLYKEAFAKLLDAMVPKEQQGLNYDPLDGRDAPASSVTASLQTYPMFPGTKVTAWLDSKVFYSQKQTAALLEKAEDVFKSKGVERAARFILDYLSIRKIGLADLNQADPIASLNLPEDHKGLTGDWLEEILAHCIDEGKKVPEYLDEGELIIQVLEKGCADNHLIITADLADKRKKLFKYIKEHGVVVDCSVPKGNVQADKQAQAQALTVQMNKVLDARGKSMEPRAFSMIQDRIGADLRTFTNTLEKLASYVGDRPVITARDVEAVVSRTKEDPIFAFTNALASKNAQESLALLDRLLAGDFHPLAVAAASANHLRRFLAIKNFLAGPFGNRWNKGMNFNAFKSTVMPAIEDHDARTQAVLDAWEDQLKVEEKEEPGKKPKKTKKAAKKLTTDLFVAPKGRNAYPIYLAFKESENFTMDELTNAMDLLIQADRDIKRHPPHYDKMIMEKVILGICAR